MLELLRINNAYLKFRKPFILDVGAGPGTAGYALAQTLCKEPGGLALRYLAVERAPEMVKLAELFLSDPAFGADVQIEVRNSIRAVRWQDIKTFAAGRDAIVVMCSYFFRQTRAREAGRDMANLVGMIAAASDLPIYLISQDANFPVDGEWLSEEFIAFKQYLRTDFGLYAPSRRDLISQGHRTVDVDTGQVLRKPGKLANVAGVVGRLRP